MTPEGVRVHPCGLCESSRVGPGTRIWAFAHVLDGAVIGRDCNICDHAYVEWGVVLGDRVTVKNGVLLYEGVTVGDDVFLGPGAVFTNDLRPRSAVVRRGSELLPTVIERRVTVGANATVVCGTTLREGCMVAAGAVVVGDVAAHRLVAGVPARPIGWVCDCGERLDRALACRSCGRAYRHASTGLAKIPPSLC